MSHFFEIFMKLSITIEGTTSGFHAPPCSVGKGACLELP